MCLIQVHINTFSATYKSLSIYPGFGWDSRDSIQEFCTDLADMAKNIQRPTHL